MTGTERVVLTLDVLTLVVILMMICAALMAKPRQRIAWKCHDNCPGDDTCDYTKWCMCGNYMDAHGVGSNHAPLSIHDYYVEPVQEYIR